MTAPTATCTPPLQLPPSELSDVVPQAVRATPRGGVMSGIGVGIADIRSTSSSSMDMRGSVASELSMSDLSVHGEACDSSGEMIGSAGLPGGLEDGIDADDGEDHVERQMCFALRREGTWSEGVDLRAPQRRWLYVGGADDRVLVLVVVEVNVKVKAFG